MTAKRNLKQHLLAAFLLITIGLGAVTVSGCGSTATPPASPAKSEDLRADTGKPHPIPTTAKPADDKINSRMRDIGVISALPSPPADRSGSGGPARMRDSAGFDAATFAKEGNEKDRPKEPDLPQVWRKDASQPTLARVTVGDHQTLDLISLHVSVVVEGPRARTVIDHVYRNPHNRQLEGTFE